MDRPWGPERKWLRPLLRLHEGRRPIERKKQIFVSKVFLDKSRFDWG